MKLDKFIISEMGVNCYIISDNDQAILIDAGYNPRAIKNYIDKNKLLLKAIFITHAHFDHIAGLDELREKYKAPVFIHKNEEHWLSNPFLNGSAMFPYFGEISCKKSENLIDSDTLIQIGNLNVEAIHTPGHSPGGVTYKINNLLFTGDALFRHSIGRTDFDGGNHKQLIESIKNKILLYNDETIVYPGHGGETTIGEEKRMNPYLNR